MTSSISTDFLSIFALLFTVFLAKRNIVINKYKNKIYLFASVITIILLILEITTLLMQLSSNIELVIPHRIANIIGFSLSPVVPFVLLFLNKQEGKRNYFKSFFALPLYFNAFMCILSYETGWVFLVDAQNKYTRGNLFLIPMIICLFYFVFMIISVIKNNIEYEIDDKKVLISILFMPILGAVLQIIFKELLLIWGSISISLILYYIFLRELQFKYDIQTGIKNRSAFEKEMEQYQKDDNNLAIIVVDINNLKGYNDKFGHKAGDELIFQGATILRESFLGVGNVFRIGGDEFCIICKDISMKLLDRKLSNLDHLLTLTNQKGNIEISLAYGYSFYIKNQNEDIYSIFNQADKAMYEHKARLKSF